MVAAILSYAIQSRPWFPAAVWVGQGDFGESAELAYLDGLGSVETFCSVGLDTF